MPLTSLYPLVIVPASEGATARCRVLDTSGLTEDLGYRLRSSFRFWFELSFWKDHMEVTLSETDRLEVVLKKFNRAITKAGLFQDMKKKRFYESPAVQRRRKSQAARRRNRTR